MVCRAESKVFSKIQSIAESSRARDDRGGHQTIHAECRESCAEIVRFPWATAHKSVFCSCNTNAQTPHTLLLCLVGGDVFIAQCLRAYTELLGNKGSQWTMYMRFALFTPGGYGFDVSWQILIRFGLSRQCIDAESFCIHIHSVASTICRVVASTSTDDTSPNAYYFADALWRDWWERVEMSEHGEHSIQ
jgi:hypothetical protein